MSGTITISSDFQSALRQQLGTHVLTINEDKDFDGFWIEARWADTTQAGFHADMRFLNDSKGRDVLFLIAEKLRMERTH